MVITQRDLQILKFIGQCGFVTIEHLQKRFGLSQPRSYQVGARLTKANLIKHERIFHKEKGVYKLTSVGVRHVGYAYLRNINFNTYHHELLIVDLLIKLGFLYPSFSFQTARDIKREVYAQGLIKAKKVHIPDLVMFDGDNKTAFEIELTVKTHARIDRILKFYKTAFDYQKVIYLCSNATINILNSKSGNLQFLTVLDYEDFLYG